MSTAGGPPGLRTRRVLGLRTLIYFYRRRLRAHATQELLAGVGIAAAVSLVLAAGVAQQSIGGSTRKVVRAVVGPADVQLRARGPQGFPEAMLGRVEALSGVERAAPLLERAIWMTGHGGRSASIYVAGTDVALGVLNGLARTLPTDALANGALALSATSARQLGLPATPPGSPRVALTVGGVRHTLRVSAVLGNETVGVLSSASVGVVSLTEMQRLLGLPGRVTRILVQSAPHQHAKVTRELQRLAGPRLIVSGAEEDVSQLNQALHPSAQASELFAVIGALLGFLFAFNAILLTVPERRQSIADLRLAGTTRSAIVQLTSFQALCLGVAASTVGLVVGYVLSRWVFHESTGYLAEAFTLAGTTVVKARTVILAGLGGVLVTWLACALPLLDLRRGSPADAIYMPAARSGGTPRTRTVVWMTAASLALLALCSVLYAAAPGSALAASVALALATVLAVPAVFAGVLALARGLSERAPRLSSLALALSGVRATSVRSLALAATGAVALFGSVALGGARSNLLEGIRSFAHAYAADAPIWVGEPGDNQATQTLAGDGGASRIAKLGGIATVARFQGAFLTVGPRRVWVIARPPGGARHLLASQTSGGAQVAMVAERRLAEGGWVIISAQIASEHHAGPGQSVTLPSPSGPHSYRVAALASTAWIPGVVIMSSRDFASAWGSRSPSALAVHPAPGVSVRSLTAEIQRALGPHSGSEVLSTKARQRNVERLTSEGLSQLGLISTLLILAAVIALAAALASSINQRRRMLASLRLSGAPPARLRRILLVEALLMLTAGCVTGALAGVYGQFVMDSYVRSVTALPVASASASLRPLEIFVAVIAAALAIAAAPAWLASRVAPGLALAEE